MLAPTSATKLPIMMGRVIAWMGTAMYAAFALGAPAGAALYGPFGFTAIALITTVNQLQQGIVSLYQSMTGDLSSIGAQQ